MSDRPQHPSPRYALRIKRALMYLFTRHLITARMTERIWRVLGTIV